MSKKFGKNQKRKLNDELHDLRDRAAKLKEQVYMERARALESESTIRLVSKVFGRNFIGLPVEQQLVYEITPTMQVAITGGYPDSRYREKHYVDHVLQTINIYPMKVSKEVDQLRRSVHIFLQTPSGDVAYAMSDNAWNHMRGDNRSYEHIAKLMLSSLKD